MCIYYASTSLLVALFEYGTIYICLTSCLRHPYIMILSFVHCGYTFIGLSTASYLIRTNICDKTVIIDKIIYMFSFKIR